MMFDTHIHSEIIITVKLINNISISKHIFFFVCVARIYSLSKFPVYNIVLLTTLIMLYIRSQDTIENKR